ncbi:hypothetical protein B0J13DRAFT_568666 [Dactylonectria estremocensis]|uniref:Hydrophobin n=1 Tax=Dactylonectria estremocensis TaxID=1079267 RepID=A0A9P9IG20_9HYPO|nr:hypothetical protein B0J13DRAFT_568666 [Dactylonectria estremocensis]
MHASAILYGLFFLQGAMAFPMAQPDLEVEARSIERREPTPFDMPMPLLPRVAKAGKDKGSPSCPGSNQVSQSNQCTSGTPFCCSNDGKGGQVCSHSTTTCKSTVICCNNNNGFQICMGDINFNMPVTININIDMDDD